MLINIKLPKEIRPNFTYKVLLTQLTCTPNLVKISSILTEIWPVAIFDQPVPLMLVRGIVGRSDVNDVSKCGFPQAAIVAVSTGGPACASRL